MRSSVLTVMMIELCCACAGACARVEPDAAVVRDATSRPATKDRGESLARRVESLTPVDFREHAVWEFVSNDGPYETYVRPVKALPATTLAFRLVGVEAELANGRPVWAMLGNVDPNDAYRTSQFVTLSVFVKNEWLHLARYHDADRDSHGPSYLAEGLGLPIGDVFPVRYDIRPWVTGSAAALAGKIGETPSVQLSQSAWMDLAVQPRVGQK